MESVVGNRRESEVDSAPLFLPMFTQLSFVSSLSPKRKLRSFSEGPTAIRPLLRCCISP